MMETMSMEYAQYGIRINNISPGAQLKIFQTSHYF